MCWVKSIKLHKIILEFRRKVNKILKDTNCESSWHWFWDTGFHSLSLVLQITKDSFSQILIFEKVDWR